MEISIKSESERFHQFLLEENNNNIIFSGIYGIGKSYFINDFFNNQHSEEYIPIILTPVNYSVANNEDIFEYIKADILLQLLEKVSCDFRNVQISISVAAYYYINNNLDNIIGNILSTAEKVCFKTDIIHQLLNLKKSIKNFQDKNSILEDKEIESFIKHLSQKQGSIYESNIITQIIQTLISSAKGENNKKEIILVIDDLDRIDPEHIFRILNILSAHDDFCHTKEHKFKFDKTILVCDIDNIRKIFHTNYGANVDFNGYIDKFYSKEVFQFHNEDEIIAYISEQIINKFNNIPNASNIDKYLYIDILFILKYLIRYNLINLRTIQKFICINNTKDEFVLYKNNKYMINKSPSIMIFENLKRIFGSSESLNSKLIKLTKKYEYAENEYIQCILDSFIILADLPNNHMEYYDYITKNYYKGVKYDINFYRDPKSLIADIDYTTYNQSSFNVFEMIYDAYSNYLTYFTKGNDINNPLLEKV